MTPPDFPHGGNPREPDDRDAQHSGGDVMRSHGRREEPGEATRSAGRGGDGAEENTEAGALTADEAALRRLMHSAVRDVAPAPDALGRLCSAVPARRARRRQILVGAGAACLLAFAAVPAVLQATGTVRTQTPNSSNAASSHSSNGTGSNEGPDGHESGAGPADGAAHGRGKGSGRQSTAAPLISSPTWGGGSSVGPGNSLAANAPACTGAELGEATGDSGSADVSGKITGYFKATNVSTAACTVDGDGDVTATAQGSADASAVTVVDHTPGDPSGLPDDSSQTLILAPGQSYEVDFAWIPASGGDSGGCPATSDPTPSDAPTGDGSGSGSATDAGSASSGTTDGGTNTTASQASYTTATSSDPASVLITHVAEAGSPTYGLTLTGVCAGTVYRTGLLLAP
jgi:hypothetical protein